MHWQRSSLRPRFRLRWGRATSGGRPPQRSRRRASGGSPVVGYDTLLERWFLPRYFRPLETASAERARALASEVRRVTPDARFAFGATILPADWFSIGLLRGLSSHESPALLLIRERYAREVVQRYTERGIVALPAFQLVPDQGRFSAADWTRLRPLAFAEHAGFWLDGTASDSVARVIRRFAK